MGFPISTNLFRSISDSGENLTRGAGILDKEHFWVLYCHLGQCLRGIGMRSE